MPPLVRSFVASVALLAAACASASKGEGSDVAATSRAPTVQPPQMDRGGPRPELRIPPTTGGRITVMRVDIEVMVDATGSADMSTFRATGNGAEFNREALRTWISAASFKPGRQDGHPVPALFKTTIEARRR